MQLKHPRQTLDSQLNEHFPVCIVYVCMLTEKVYSQRQKVEAASVPSAASTDVDPLAGSTAGMPFIRRCPTRLLLVKQSTTLDHQPAAASCVMLLHDNG